MFYTFHSVYVWLQNLSVSELKWEEQGRENITWCVYFCRNVGHPHPLQNLSPSTSTSPPLFWQETSKKLFFFPFFLPHG